MAFLTQGQALSRQRGRSIAALWAVGKWVPRAMRIIHMWGGLLGLDDEMVG